MLGVYEQQRYPVEYTTVLNIDNLNYIDSSVYNHPVNIVGSVPISDGGYRITGNTNYLSIPSHPVLNLSLSRLRLSLEIRQFTTGLTSQLNFYLGRFTQFSTSTLDYVFRVVAVTSTNPLFVYYVNNGTVANSGDISYGANFRNDYQLVVVEWRRTFYGEGNSASKKGFYSYNPGRSNLLGSFVSSTTPQNLVLPFTIGSTFNDSNADYLVRNIKVEMA
jgi:hypothetical protein